MATKDFGRQKYSFSYPLSSTDRLDLELHREGRLFAMENCINDPDLYRYHGAQLAFLNLILALPCKN